MPVMRSTLQWGSAVPLDEQWVHLTKLSSGNTYHPRSCYCVCNSTKKAPWTTVVTDQSFSTISSNTTSDTINGCFR